MPTDRHDLSILIPIYNEVQTLSKLLLLIETTPLPLSYELILVDAGSTDGSREIIQAKIGHNGCKVIMMPQKSGKGLAVRTGLAQASGRIIIIQDGDLEYSPSDYPELLKPLLNGTADFVIGSRVLKAQTWRFRTKDRFNFHLWTIDLGGRFLKSIFCTLFRVKMSDPLTMFKVFRREHIKVDELKCNSFDFDWELLCNLINNNLKFVEVPVSYSARTVSEGKKLRASVEGFKALWVMFQAFYDGRKPVLQKIPDLQAVEIEINHACNRRCSYCPNSVEERKTKGRMSRELYLSIVEQLAGISFSGRISYDFYNEPLLHPDLLYFVEQTKIRLPDVSIHLYSNGTLLSEEKFKALSSAGIDLFVITRHEEDIGKDQYTFAKVFDQLTADQKLKVRYRDHTDLHLVNRGGILTHLGKDGLPLHPCHLPSHMLTITVDGRILSCFEDFREEQVFGDLKTQKLIDIWETPSYISFRKDLKRGLRHLHSPCRNCNRKEVLPPFGV